MFHSHTVSSIVSHGAAKAKVGRKVGGMARSLNKLSALAVKNAAPGKYADGGGLWLHKREGGAGQWFFRFTIYGRRREMGLGSIVEVSLKDAREAAEKWRAASAKGLDPIKERERERREAEKRLHILREVAEDAFESRKAELKGDGEDGRWYSPVKVHILPRLGTTPVGEIDQTVIRNTLAPIWHKGRDRAKGLKPPCYYHAPCCCPRPGGGFASHRESEGTAWAA